MQAGNRGNNTVNEIDELFIGSLIIIQCWFALIWLKNINQANSYEVESNLLYKKKIYGNGQTILSFYSFSHDWKCIFLLSLINIMEISRKTILIIIVTSSTHIRFKLSHKLTHLINHFHIDFFSCYWTVLEHMPRD